MMKCNSLLDLNKNIPWERDILGNGFTRQVPGGVESRFNIGNQSYRSFQPNMRLYCRPRNNSINQTNKLF